MRSCGLTTKKRNRCWEFARSQRSRISSASLGACAELPAAWRSEALPLGLAQSILDHPLEASRFDGFASVAGLKADGETAFLSKLRGMPNLKLLTGVAAVELVGERDNPRHIVGVRLADGRVLHARAVLLAAGALHSPRLLAQYLGASGLAQQLPAAANVGRNLKLHLLTAVVAVSLSRKTDVIRKTTLLLNDALPHSSIQPLGFDGELIATLVPQVVPRVLARQIGQRAYGFFLQTEDGSHADNRVSAGAVPTMDYDATRLAPAMQQHDRLVTTFKRSLGKAGLLAFSERIGLAGTAHACGTLVTGMDAQRSVVDASGRVHGMEGLYVVDGSILPRSSRVNPSLTIYSWSLRVARALALQFAGSAGRAKRGGAVMRLRILAALCLLALSAIVRADSSGAAPIVASVDSIGITVDDMDRAVEFYTKVLGFEKLDAARSRRRAVRTPLRCLRHAARGRDTAAGR